MQAKYAHLYMNQLVSITDCNYQVPTLIKQYYAMCYYSYKKIGRFSDILIMYYFLATQ